MSLSDLLSHRNFRLHWASVALAHTGSFFTTVALPWLVLSLANDDPFVMTSVLATVALPHGLFMLCGGALADRFTPMRTLILSRSAFVLTMGALAVLTGFHLLPLWAIYVFALALGTLGAVGIPASQALLPNIVSPSALGGANGIIMGTLQVAQIMAPVMAGWLIWFGRNLRPGSDDARAALGAAFAFAIDASAVAVSAILVARVKVRTGPSRRSDVLQLFREGASYCWGQRGLRLVLTYLTIVSFFLHGPLLASLPLYTKLTLGLQERAFGGLYAMVGVGTISGVVAAMLIRPAASVLGVVVLVCDLTGGLALLLLGFVTDPFSAGVLLFCVGLGLGIVMVAGTTWFQTRTPPEYMGRVMSLMMFAGYGLVPVSATLAGLLIAYASVRAVLVGCGALIASVAAAGLMLPRVRNMGAVPEYRHEPSPVVVHASL